MDSVPRIQTKAVAATEGAAFPKVNVALIAAIVCPVIITTNRAAKCDTICNLVRCPDVAIAAFKRRAVIIDRAGHQAELRQSCEGIVEVKPDAAA